MPKFYTVLLVKSKKGIQKIKIDEDCNDFYGSDHYQARKVKKYLEFIYKVLQSKPEINNAPDSDIIYM